MHSSSDIRHALFGMLLSLGGGSAILVLGFLFALPIHGWMRWGWSVKTKTLLIEYLGHWDVRLEDRLLRYAKWLQQGDVIAWTPAILGILVIVIGVGLQIQRLLRPITYGDARWAEARDIRRMRLLKGKWMILGRWRGKALMLPETLSALCVAPPGTGKTAAIVVPTILTAGPCSLVIHDVKPELAQLTSGARALVSAIWCLDWGKEGAHYPCWNPLSPAHIPLPSGDRDLYIERLVRVVIEAKGEGNAEYFQNKARAVLTAFILWMLEMHKAGRWPGEPSFAGLQDGIAAQLHHYAHAADPMQLWLQETIAQIHAAGYPVRISTELTQLLGTAAEERGSILSTLYEGLSIFKNAAVKERTSRSDFAFADLRGRQDAAGRVQPVTIYLMATQENAKALAKITGLFCEALSMYLISHPPCKEGLGPFPVMFVLDEFPQMPKLEAVLEGPAVGRGQKVSYLMIAQDLGQIEARYGAPGVETLMSTTAAKIVLPLNNEKTAKRFSEMVGKTTIVTQSKSGMLWEKHQITKQETGIDFLPTERWMAMKKGTHIVLFQNAMNRPIQVTTPFYFKNRSLRKATKLPPVLPNPHAGELPMKQLMAAALVMAGVATAQAETQVSYPPYPDVWGYDLTKYERPNYKNELPPNIFLIENGDIYFTFADQFDAEKEGGVERFVWIKFFEQFEQVINGGQYNEIGRKYDENRVFTYNQNHLTLSDGTVYRRNHATGNCGNWLRDNYIEEISADGKTKEAWIFLYYVLHPEPEPEQYCEADRSNITFRVKPADFEFIPLKEDNFLLINANTIVRFKKGLETKDPNFYKRFYKMKLSEFEALLEGTDDAKEHERRIFEYLSSHLPRKEGK